MSMLQSLNLVPAGLRTKDALWYMDMLEEKGGRMLGCGISTTAYAMRVRKFGVASYKDIPYIPPSIYNYEAIEESVVVRVTDKDKDQGGWLANRIAYEHQDDPYAPKIYELLDLGSWGVCVMEELSYGGDYPYSQALWDSWKGLNYIVAGHSARASRPNLALLDKSPYMSALNYAHEGGEGLRWDLHKNNVMMRGEQLVVVDPLSGELT